MIKLRQKDTAEMVIGNHLASLAVYSVNHNSAETLTKIEEMKTGLTEKLCQILDPMEKGE
jgi:hypothetical protein